MDNIDRSFVRQCHNNWPHFWYSAAASYIHEFDRQTELSCKQPQRLLFVGIWGNFDVCGCWNDCWHSASRDIRKCRVVVFHIDRLHDDSGLLQLPIHSGCGRHDCDDFLGGEHSWDCRCAGGVCCKHHRLVDLLLANQLNSRGKFVTTQRYLASPHSCKQYY